MKQLILLRFETHLVSVVSIICAMGLLSCKSKKSSSSLEAIVSLDGKSAMSLLPLQDQAQPEAPIAYGVVHCESPVSGDAIRAAELLEAVTTRNFDSLGVDSGKLVYNRTKDPISHISNICTPKGALLSGLVFAGTLAISPVSDEDFYVRQVLWLAARGKYDSYNPSQGFTTAFYQFLYQSLGAVDDDALNADEKHKRVTQFDEWYNPCAAKAATWKFAQLRNSNFDCENNHYKIKDTALAAYKTLDGLHAKVGTVQEQPEMRGKIAAFFGVKVPDSAAALRLQGAVDEEQAAARSHWTLEGYTTVAPGSVSAGSTGSGTVRIYKPVAMPGAINSTNSPIASIQKKETEAILSAYEHPKMDSPKTGTGKLDPKCNIYLTKLGTSAQGANNHDCDPGFWKGGGSGATDGDQGNSGATGSGQGNSRDSQRESACYAAFGAFMDDGYGRRWCYCQAGSHGFAQRVGGWMRKIDDSMSCADFVRKEVAERDAHKIRTDALHAKILAERQAAAKAAVDEQQKKAQEEAQRAEANLRTAPEGDLRDQARREFNQSQDNANRLASIQKQIENADQSPEQNKDEELITPPPGGLVVIEDAKGNTRVSSDPMPANTEMALEPTEEVVARCKAKGALGVERISKSKVGDRWEFRTCDCGEMEPGDNRSSFSLDVDSEEDCKTGWALFKQKWGDDAPNVAPEPKLAKDGPQICKEKGGNYQGSVCDCGYDSLSLVQYVQVNSKQNCRTKMSLVNSDISDCTSRNGQPKMDHKRGRYSCTCEGFGYRFATDGKCRLIGTGFLANFDKKPGAEFQAPPDNRKRSRSNSGLRQLNPIQEELEGDGRSTGGLLRRFFGKHDSTEEERNYEERKKENGFFQALIWRAGDRAIESTGINDMRFRPPGE